MYLGSYVLLAVLVAGTAAMTSPRSKRWAEATSGNEPLNMKQATFQGCFDNYHSTFELYINSRQNTNPSCAEFCNDRGYIISATQMEFCGCTNTLPLPQLARPEFGNSSGPSSACNQRCPGVFNPNQCYGDECCGGAGTYSVYTSGFLDILTQISRRIRDNMKADPKWFFTRFFRFVQTGGRVMHADSELVMVTNYENRVEECEDKCLAKWNCDGYSYNIRTRECHGFNKAAIGAVNSDWMSATLFYGFDRQRDMAVSGGYLIKQTHFEWTYLECEEQCLDVDGCNGYMWNDYTRACRLYGGVHGFSYTGEYRFNAAKLTESTSGNAWVTARGMTISQNGGKAYKECKVSIFGATEKCSNLASQPNDDLYMEVQMVERELKHDLGSSMEPAGYEDVELNNYNGNTPLSTTKSFTITTGSSNGYSTSSGTDISTTFGTGVTVGFEIFGLKQETSVTSEMSSSGFFNVGFSTSQSVSYSETRSFTLIVNGGYKGYLNIFKEEYRLQVS